MPNNQKLTFSFCTYNRAERLERLVSVMREQTCPIPFEILAINNNSQDDTLKVLQQLATLPGPLLRFVTETEQGIVAARNRAIYESLNSDILVFIDDDEIPLPGLLNAACDAILNEDAECVGGRVEMDFSTHSRPEWLKDELLGFLAATDYGDNPFWVETNTTPLWTANIAYNINIFRNDNSLRFDARYDRKGNIIGGGSDAIMFRNLLTRKTRIRYRPDMTVLHDVEPWRLTRSYFLKLHFRSGLRHGLYELPIYEKTFFDLPPFLIMQLFRHIGKAIMMIVTNHPSHMRQSMNVSYALATIIGYYKRTHNNRTPKIT